MMFGATAVKSAVAPYLVWIVLAAIAGAAAFGAWQGYRVGSEHQIAANVQANAKLEKAIGEKNTSLRDAAVALRAASNAIKAINRQAARARADAHVAKQAERAAKGLADAFAQQLRRSRAGFEDALARARSKPSCAALLDFDVRAELQRAGCPALLNGAGR